jgi:magnesium chelatase subunit D
VDRQQVFEIGDPFLVKNLHRDRDRLIRKAAGKRSTSQTSKHQGRYVKSRPAREATDIAFDATLRVAAPYQRSRRNDEDLALTIRRWDLQQKVRERKIGNLFLFIVDASNSMAARQRMVATKGAIMSLLMDAYQKRDKTAMVVFQKREADLVLPPTSSIDLAAKLLKELPVGGRTPLSAGLVKGYTVLKNYLLKDPLCRPVVIILTDAKANIALGDDDPFEEALRAARKMAEDELIEFIVVDTVEPRQINLGAARRLAHALNGEYLLIEDLRTQDLLDIARSKTE